MMGGGSRRGNPRRSGTRAITFWVVALVAGTSAALLLRWYIERSAQPVAAPVAKIVVAAVDLPIATTLRPEHLRLADWPATAQPPGVVHDIKELSGRVLVAKVFQGEPLLTSKLASKDAGRGLAALIPEGMRAEAVRVDEVVGVAGFVHPDDRVDVIGTFGGPISKVILQNVKVLAVGKELEVSDASRTKAMPVTVATLLVTPAESEKLALTANSARLTLTLRSWTDGNSSETPGATQLSVLTGAEALTRRAAAPPPAAVEGSPIVATKRGRHARAETTTTAPTIPTTPQKDVIEILRGDRLEERKFDKDKP